MTKLYAMDLRPFQQNGSWRRLLPDLPDSRQDRVLGCRFDVDRARSAGAGWLAQYALTREGLSREELIYERTDLGKPYLPRHRELEYSLSHAGFWAVCAVSDHPIGVDVETPRCSKAVAARFFCPEEMENLEQLSYLEQMIHFNRLWTAKEAFTKALGTGLTTDLKSFQVLLSRDGAQLRQTLSPLPYRLHEYRLEVSNLCLCCTDDRPELRLVTP